MFFLINILNLNLSVAKVISPCCGVVSNAKMSKTRKKVICIEHDQFELLTMCFQVQVDEYWKNQVMILLAHIRIYVKTVRIAPLHVSLGLTCVLYTEV